MSSFSSALVFALCVAICICFGVSMSAAQVAEAGSKSQPAAQPSGISPADLPARVTIEQHGWGPDGELVLGIRVHAASNKPLELGKLAKSEEEEPIVFTLQDSYLMDIKTTGRLNPLSKRLKKPYFGPVSAITSLPANGWVQLSVTFPTPPDPGRDARGNPLPYQLRYFPPMGLPHVDVSIPQRVAAVQKPASP